MKLFPSVALLVVVACQGCGHKGSTGPSNANASTDVKPEPLRPGMTSYLNDLPASTGTITGFNPVVNPGVGISMAAPPGFEWSNAQNVVEAFSNVIGMNESGAPEPRAPIHLFYALPDALRELMYATRMEADVYDPMDYEHYLGKIKTNKFVWKDLPLMMTAMGPVPVRERTDDAMETYSNGNPKKFKIFIREYALAWKSNLVIVTTVTPESMDVRFRGNIEQAIGSVRLIPKSQGQLVLPPEGPKAAHYGLKGAAHPGDRAFGAPRGRDPLEEMRQINEFNQRNQQRDTNQPPAQGNPPTNQDGAGGQNAPPTTPPTGQGQDGGATNNGG